MLTSDNVYRYRANRVEKSAKLLLRRIIVSDHFRRTLEKRMTRNVLSSGSFIAEKLIRITSRRG